MENTSASRGIDMVGDKKTDKATLLAFVQEAHAIWYELTDKGGPLARTVDARTRRVDREMALQLFEKPNIRHLNDVLEPYLEAFMSATPEIRFKIDQRLMKVTGQTTSGSVEELLMVADKVLVRGRVIGRKEHASIRLLFDLSKNNTIQVDRKRLAELGKLLASLEATK
jgi:hypothetical protein